MSVDTHGDYLHNLWSTTIFGQQAIQYPADLWLYERVLTDMTKDNAGVRGLLELGSGSGGLSLYLALQCRAREAQFWTVDRFTTPAATTPLGLFLDLASRCLTGDIWTDEFQRRLFDLLANPGYHPFVLLCDNGDKPREFRTFVPRLQAGDVVFVHDFHNEFDVADIPATLEPKLEMLYASECEALGLLTRAWRVK